MNNYLVIDATGFTAAQLQAELLLQTRSEYYFKCPVVIGTNTFLVFAPKSLVK